MTFYEADSSGVATTTLATLYSAAVGATTVSNPQTLDSEGKLAAPVFIDTPVIASVTGALADPHSTGAIAPRGTHKGDWATTTRYSSGDTVRDPTTGSLYASSNDFTSDTTLAADVSNGDLEIIVDASQILTDLTSNFAKAIDLAFTFSTTTAMADPGAGIIRLNNATIASVTAIALDDTTAATGNPDVSAYLATFDDSTNTTKGHLMVRRPSAPQNFAIFAVTALTDNSGWMQLTVTHVASSGSFSASDTITATFHRAGDKGLAVSPGVLYDFASSTTMADPSAGNVRLNNATLSSVTAVAVNDASAAPGNPDVSRFLLTWDDSTAGNKGLMVIKKIGEPENFAVFQLSALTDNTAWIQFTVSYVDHAGSFSASDNLSIEFIPTIGATATAPVQDVGVTSTIGTIDAGKLLRATAAVTYNMTAAATLADGWYCFVYADGGDVTIDPNASETVNGAATLTVSENNGGTLFCSGSAFYFIDGIQSTLDLSANTTIPFPRGHFQGLHISNNSTDANNDIDTAEGECRDDADSENMVLASTLIKQINASWTVGTNQGGLDTGSEANSTWYFVWLIKRTDTGVVDVLFSTSATAPTMPTSYDKKRRIGAIYNDSSGNITPFIQDGDWFIWKDPITDVNVSNFGTSATLYTLSVPTLINAVVCANFRVFQSASATTALFTGPDESDATPTSARFDILTVGGFDSGNVYRHVRTNTSAQVRAKSTTANNTLTIITRGWFDLRGRED